MIRQSYKRVILENGGCPINDFQVISTCVIRTLTSEFKVRLPLAVSSISQTENLLKVLEPKSFSIHLTASDSVDEAIITFQTRSKYAI